MVRVVPNDDIESVALILNESPMVLHVIEADARVENTRHQLTKQALSSRWVQNVTAHSIQC